MTAGSIHSETNRTEPSTPAKLQPAGCRENGWPSELARLFKRLRSVHGKQAAEEAVAELAAFLKPTTAETLTSLHEAGEDLIALQSLDVPNPLHRNLLSTNAIENSLPNTPRKMGRVKRFRVETDQATRWLAFALVEVEKGFRRISGHKDLPHLIAALEKPKNPPPKFSSDYQRTIKW